MKFFVYFIHLTLLLTYLCAAETNPFKAIGIEELDVKSFIGEPEHDQRNPKFVLRSIEDVPKFLKMKDIQEEEGIRTLTKFLIQDDPLLVKYGIVYDQTGFDALDAIEKIAEEGTEERLIQRAKSSANLYFRKKHQNLEYEAYGGDFLNDEVIDNWRILRMMMIGKNGENSFVKVCMPLDENTCALCSDNNEKCDYRVKVVEEEKAKNKEYIEKIKKNQFFSKKQETKKLLKLRDSEKGAEKKNEPKEFKFKQKSNEFDTLKKEIEDLRNEMRKKDVVINQLKKSETTFADLGLKSELENPFT